MKLSTSRNWSLIAALTLLNAPPEKLLNNVQSSRDFPQMIICQFKTNNLRIFGYPFLLALSYPSSMNFTRSNGAQCYAPDDLSTEHMRRTQMRHYFLLQQLVMGSVADVDRCCRFIFSFSNNSSISSPSRDKKSHLNQDNIFFEVTIYA